MFDEDLLAELDQTAEVREKGRASVASRRSTHSTSVVHYLRRPFHREPDFGATSVNHDFAEPLARAKEPR